MIPFPGASRATVFALIFLLFTVCSGCHSSRNAITPSIEFTEVPEVASGGAARMERIAGRVTGTKAAGQKVVLFARSGTWWVQPFSNTPFTPIQQDSTWRSPTHMGTEYAALLVEPGYTPPRTTDVLPEKGGKVIAVARVEGSRSRTASEFPPRKLHFSGYEWEIVQVPSDSGGVMHINSASNAWTDAKGWLHLRIALVSGEWTCAEIAMSRSLGYGSYSFVIQHMPQLEPGSVFGMFTWDPLEGGQNHREIDVELSQWGDPISKNAQFAIQPYYVPANVFRFNAPSGGLTHSFRWEPGRVSFQTARETRVIAEHVFTSGIPSPGGERVHINLYIYGKSRTLQQNGVEVVIEKFAYLP